MFEHSHCTDGPQLMLRGEVCFSMYQSNANSNLHLTQILLYQFSLKGLSTLIRSFNRPKVFHHLGLNKIWNNFSLFITSCFFGAMRQQLSVDAVKTCRCVRSIVAIFLLPDTQVFPLTSASPRQVFTPPPPKDLNPIFQVEFLTYCQALRWNYCCHD